TVPELFQAAQRIVATTYEPLILYIEAALIYLVLSSVLSQLQAACGGIIGKPGAEQKDTAGDNRLDDRRCHRLADELAATIGETT
ncbi:hypothetical protein ACC718_38670, partial [Rhizobium ruizarguesonis]